MSGAPNFADHFRRALEECDIATMRKLHAHVFPQLPPPGSDFEVLATIHRARTQSIFIPVKKRAWSHRWLLDHDLPSGLPDLLKPHAERIYPTVVHAVGISVSSTSGLLAPLAKAMEQAMSDAVAEAYANHQSEPEFVKARMSAARDRILKS
jgi:hypothetical protein